jgi:hypothetical protein
MTLTDHGPSPVRDSLPVSAEAKDEQRDLWDRWWYDRFEIPNDLPPGLPTCRVEVDGLSWTLHLLEHVAPVTTRAFRNALPLDGHVIHCAWFGHAAYFLDRIDLPEVGYELENRNSKLAPGDWIWDPYIKEITFAYGRHAQVNFPTAIHMDGRVHPNQACIFARITEDLDAFAAWCKSVRFEGTKRMRITEEKP